MEEGGCALWPVISVMETNISDAAQTDSSMHLLMRRAGDKKKTMLRGMTALKVLEDGIIVDMAKHCL